MAEVTMITASLGERMPMLYRAMQSVALQTVRPKAHFVALDPRPVAIVRTELIHMARTEWVGFLDDDDQLLDHHIETLLAHSDDADVVIPHCKFDGEPLPDGYYNRPFSRAVLNEHGIFPITVLARRRAVLDVGGFHAKDQWEDFSLWNRMANIGARFKVVPEVTWIYHTKTANRRTDMLNGSD